MSAEDVTRLRAAADQLTIAPRPARWTHLALCVIDAVWSINANYDTVVVPICRAYAVERELPDPLLPVSWPRRPGRDLRSANAHNVRRVQRVRSGSSGAGK